MKITLFYNAKILVYNDTLPYRGIRKYSNNYITYSRDIDIACNRGMTSRSIISASVDIPSCDSNTAAYNASKNRENDVMNSSSCMTSSADMTGICVADENCLSHGYFVDAMIVADKKILKLGDEKSLRTFLKSDGFKACTKSENLDYCEINLGGRFVMPGFVDCHEHPILLSHCLEEISCLPPNVTSIEELKSRVAEERERLIADGVKPDKSDKWIIGWGCDEGKYPEKRLPTRWDLDEVCPDFPVTLVRTCEHIRCCNSLALKMAGIDENTENPDGGEIGRDENGIPNGILYENARNLIAEILPHSDREHEVMLIKKLGDMLTRHGVTSVCEMGNLSSKDNHFIYYDAVKNGLKQNISLFYMWEFYKNKPKFEIKGEHKCLDQQIHVAGLKLIGDGSFSGHTAWTDVPYLGTEEYGISTCSDELLDSAIEFCRRNNLQISIHAMGKRAIDRFVERLYKEKPWEVSANCADICANNSVNFCSDVSPNFKTIIENTDNNKISNAQNQIPHARIEHVTEPSENAVNLAAKRGIAIATQPIFIFSEIESYQKNLGDARLKTTYPIRHLIDTGCFVGLSTDAPATAWSDPANPWINIKAAVTRKAYNGVDTEQKHRISLEEAILLYTKNSAIIAGMPYRGCIAEGYFADFQVLNENPFEKDIDKIEEIMPEKVYISGEEVL
ncbi:MAG: amidohydrolase [Christensenellales bacterium]